MIKRIIPLLLFFCISSVVFAQQPSKEELQKKQQDLLSEINDLNKTLKQIKNNKRQSLANYNLVKRKIEAREELIQSINKDIHTLDDNIYLNQLEINRLRRELDTLKHEYAQSLVFAYKNRSNYDYLNFIFSASTFNDAIKRITYLKSYRQYREQQVANIEKTENLISNKIATLNNSKNEKSIALQDHSKQLVNLEEDKKEQNEEVNKLKSQEKDIVGQIRKRESDRQQMQAAIAAIIRRELAEARKRAAEVARQKKAAEDERKRKLAEQRKQEQAQQAQAANTGGSKQASGAPASTASADDEPITGVASVKTKSDRPLTALETTEEERAQSINFEVGRGKLPWPVNGIITIHFGPYTIPGTLIKGKSDGIVISSPVNANVHAVADGEVSSVYDLGGEQAVTIRHGKYFTTYSHLSSASVSQGQQVGPQTVVGKTAANDVGDGEVLFMVTNERGVFLNPEQWIKRR